MLYKVQNHPDLMRIDDSKAIINNDDESLQSYKLKRERDRKLSRVFEEHENLKNQLSEIKSLLLKLSEKNS